MKSLINKQILRNRVSNSIRKVISQFNENSYLIAGIPRCGTTLVCGAIAKNNPRIYRAPGFVVNISEHNHFTKGWLYKTHDFPNSVSQDNLKVVFLFGDPLDSALSASVAFIGREVAAAMHQHVDEYVKPNDVFYSDAYRLEDNFDSWYREQSFQFASVRYESLYDVNVQEQLNSYLGFRLRLPERRTRKSNAKDHPRYSDLVHIYGRLQEKINQAEDIRIWMPAS